MKIYYSVKENGEIDDDVYWVEKGNWTMPIGAKYGTYVIANLSITYMYIDGGKHTKGELVTNEEEIDKVTALYIMHLFKGDYNGIE